jgi:hypothetical protein
MNCTPVRLDRQKTSDMDIINGFIVAACSGPYLEIFSLDMTSFRVRTRDGVEVPYPASPILKNLTSKHLRDIHLVTVDVDERELSQLVSTASLFHLKCNYLADVTPSSGGYEEIMAIIHETADSKQLNNFFTPLISFSTFQGAEFEDPRTLQGDDMWKSDSAERREAL